MELALRLIFYYLVFNAILIALIFLWYLKITRYREMRVNFEEYISWLFSIGKIHDPWILIGDQWVKPTKATYHPSPIT